MSGQSLCSQPLDRPEEPRDDLAVRTVQVYGGEAERVALDHDSFVHRLADDRVQQHTPGVWPEAWVGLLTHHVGVNLIQVARAELAGVVLGGLQDLVELGVEDDWGRAGRAQDNVGDHAGQQGSAFAASGRKVPPKMFAALDIPGWEVGGVGAEGGSLEEEAHLGVANVGR